MAIVFRGNLHQWTSLRNFYRREIMKKDSTTRDYQLEDQFMKILDEQVKLFKEIKEYIRVTPVSKERDDHIMVMLKQLKKMGGQRKVIRRTIFPDIEFPKTLMLK